MKGRGMQLPGCEVKVLMFWVTVVMKWIAEREGTVALNVKIAGVSERQSVSWKHCLVFL